MNSHTHIHTHTEEIFMVPIISKALITVAFLI